MQYGVEIILGEYGAGKSFYTHRKITNIFNKNSIKIGNYSSSDFDVQFRSVKDLITILEYIYNFKKDPKNIKKPILIIVDEAPLYFGSRNFKDFPKKLLNFLVQLRKLKVKLVVIAQDLKMLDINFRRLCYNVKKYYKFLIFLRMFKNFELLSEDANIQDPLTTRLIFTGFSFGPFLTLNLFGKRTKIFGSSLYDTNELIIPDYDIIDLEILKKLFPSEYLYDTPEEYKKFIYEKTQLMLK